MADIQKIHHDSAGKLNVSLEDYFTHPEVLKEYEHQLMIDKIVNQLTTEGKLNDTYTISNFVEELKKENRYSTSINQRALADSE